MYQLHKEAWPLEIEELTSTRETHMIAIERVIRTVRAQLTEPLPLEDMADVACLSPYYFNRIFHQIVGIPPGEYQAALRIDLAKRLLVTTSLSITDICFEVGYSSLGSFTSRFTRMVCFSPGQLRHVLRHESIFPAVSGPYEPYNIRPMGVYGRILSSHHFRGTIFAGLFRKPIPMERPVRCTVLSQPGEFRIAHVPDGMYFLLVAALPVSEHPGTYIVAIDHALVAKKGPLLVTDGRIEEPVEVYLRKPLLTDPPIVTALL